MNKNTLLTALIVSAALFGQSCGNKENKQAAAQTQQANPATPVAMATVTKEIVSGLITYPATVVPLQETEIRAEVTGYVTGIFVADGAVVSKGQRLYEIDRTRYQAAVDQAKASLEIAKANLDRVQKDLQRYQTLADKDAIATQIFATLPDGSRYESAGRIVTIDRAVDSQTGTLKVRASFSNPTNALRAGMNTTLNLQTTSVAEEVVIPYKAVFEQLGVFNVYTVNDSSQVDIKQITLGNKVDDKVVIKSGLSGGEKIVVEGVASIRPGAKVTELPAQPAEKK